MSTFVGRVVATKMQKTAKVEVCRMVLHPHVLKYFQHRKVFFAHDESEECVEGDVVMIKSCLPISKKKHFVIDEILERAPRPTSQQPPLQDSEQPSSPLVSDTTHSN